MHARIGVALVIIGLLAIIADATCAHAAPDTAPTHATPRQRLIDGEYARTVGVLARCSAGKHRILLSSGSGVRVGGHTVLTAHHVVECPDGGELLSLFVEDEGGTRYSAVVDGVTPTDVARLTVVKLPVMSPLRVDTATRGQVLCASFANPEPGRRCGEMWPSKDVAPGDVHVDLVAEHGNSGGPLWNDLGNLVGIVIYQRLCRGTEDNGQVCTLGATSMADRAWLIAP